MPLGLYTSCEVTAPCGLCSTEGIIGLLDVPDTFLDPDRMKAGLIWFTRGFVEYQFPNNARLSKNEIESMEFSMELSSEVPGTCGRLAVATSPSRSTARTSAPGPRRATSATSAASTRPTGGSSRAASTASSRAGASARDGTYVDGVKISPVSLKDLDVETHHSIRLRIGVKADAKHPGRHQHLRPRLRQLRPGHRAAPAHQALIGARRPARRARTGGCAAGPSSARRSRLTWLRANPLPRRQAVLLPYRRRGSWNCPTARRSRSCH